MALDFPSSPSVGQKYPASPIAGVPTYNWDGEKWTTIGGALADQGSPATALPLAPVDPAVVGVSTKYAREDHQHPTSKATYAEYLSNSAPNKLLTPGAVWAASSQFVLSDTSGTITADLGTGIDFIVILSGVGRTFANPLNAKTGQKGLIYFIQDGTGGRTITTWGPYWRFIGGVKPVMSAGPNVIDIFSYVVYNPTNLFGTFNAGFL
jgi:hypothetical protein